MNWAENAAYLKERDQSVLILVNGLVLSQEKREG